MRSPEMGIEGSLWYVLVVARIAVGLWLLRNRTGTRHSDFLSAVEESKGGPSGEDGVVGSSDVDGSMKLWSAESCQVSRDGWMRCGLLECECCGGDSPQPANKRA